jgi:hypothetical protein
MKILSIDVGIKNLAVCLLEYIENDEFNTSLNSFNIILWDVINLCDDKKGCSFDKCKNEAKYIDENDETCLCLKHCKTYKLKIPPKDFNEKILKKIKLDEIKELISKYNINIETGMCSSNKIKYTKNHYLKNINNFIDLNYLKPIKITNANDVDLISIGIKIKKKLDLIFFYNEENEKNCLGEDIDLVLIENQISPIANRMKTIQGMISQYFIMKDVTNIIYYSASNKLKQFIDDKTDYKERKTLSVEYTKQILNNTNHDNHDIFKKWEQFFILHKKKDDLADSFLQGLSYMNTNLKFNTLNIF